MADAPASGKKRPVGGIVLTDKKVETALDDDSDMVSDDDAPKPKRAKPAGGSSTGSSKAPPQIKRAPRLQFAGQRDADKSIMFALDNGNGARVIVVTLDWRKDQYAEAHQVIKASDFTGRFEYKLDNGDLNYIGPDEFLGFFYTEASGEPGVGKVIAQLLLESEHNHVVVVDGTPKGEEFARLAALAAAHFYKLLPGGNGELWKVVRKFPTRSGKPVFPHWTAVTNRLARCKSETLLRTAMKEHYEEHLADRSPF